jgi:lipid II:glycine glycyltransferase (peptidoglycan interpeptide bridge formation enzyme)
MLNIIKLDDSFNAKWDEYVTLHQSGTIFHTTNWLKLCEKHQGSELIRVGFYVDGKLVGICPLFFKRMMLFKIAASPIVVEDTPYMGPLLDNKINLLSAFQSLGTFLKKQKISFMRFVLPDLIDSELVNILNCNHYVRHTHLLDLSFGEERIWNKMEGRARTAIRKSEKSGVKVKISDDVSIIDKYYELSRALYTNQNKIPPNQKQFYKDLCFGELKSNCRLFTAIYNGEVAACAIIVFFNNTAYYLDAVSDKNYNNLCPTSGLQWEIIKWLIDNDISTYDFVGSDMPWIAKFKASFGGKLIEYSLLEKASSPIVYSIRDLYGKKLKPLSQKIISMMKYKTNLDPE